MRVAIVGAGNFGTAIANIVADNGYPTNLWMRDEQQLADILEHGENRRYLKDYPLSTNVVPTCDLATAVGSSDVVFVTVPSASFRQVTMDVAQHVKQDTFVVSGTKGIEAEGFHLMSQILEEVLPACVVGVISGPNLAEEIAGKHFTGTVVASQSLELCEMVQNVLCSATFRVYSSNDVYGLELGGALKNIYAIVCGMGAGLEVGQNTISMLITRGLAEMSRFAVSLGANPFTFLGLAGVGDLIVTCTSPLSRNFQLGLRIAQGHTLNEAMEQLGKLAEGVNTLEVIRDKSQELGVHMPLVDALFRVLFEEANIGEIFSDLMTSGDAVEFEFSAPESWGYKT